MKLLVLALLLMGLPAQAAPCILGGPILTGCRDAATAPAGSPPTVSVQTFTISTPATNGQAVGTASATNSPTSWSITACVGCVNYFAISAGGAVTVTATGAAGIAGDENSYTPTIQATNASGSGSASNTINGYADGYNARPASVTAQLPTLLNGETARPPWKVACVDYGVGVPGNITLKDPATIMMAGVTVNPNQVRVDGTSGVTFDGYDFTLSGGYQVNFLNTSPNGTIKNSKIGFASNDTTSGGMTFEYNTWDDTGGSGTGTFIFNQGVGPIVLRWNYFLHSVEDVIQGVVENTTYRYNCINNSGVGDPAGHVNYGTLNGNSVPSYNVAFNTVNQQPQNAGGEGFQFYGCCGQNPINIDNPLFAYNTMLTSGVIAALSYLINGDSGFPVVTNGIIKKNYWDDTATLGGPPPAGSGSIGGGVFHGPMANWTCTGNIMMQNGAAKTC